MMQTWSPDVFAAAWEFATQYHQGQTYGGKTAEVRVDYLNHIASVAMETIWALPAVPEADGNLAVQCALLHDTLEDTAATAALLVARFGPAVADGVQALTKNSTLDKAAQMAESLDRIRAQPAEIWMVKMADRITNLYHPPFYWKQDKITAYRQEALTIYEALHPANPALAQRLRDKIERYQEFATPSS